MKTILLFWLAFAWSLTTYAQSSDNRIVEGAYFPNAYVNKNYLKNPTCDKNINDITKTGSSTLSTSATGKIKGAKSCNFNATASTETLTFAAFTQEQELYGRNCEASFTYTGDGSLYKTYVKQGSTQVTVDLTLTATTTISKKVVMNFPCGDISTAPTVVIEATGDGAAIIIDDVYYGLVTNLSTASVDTDWAAVTVTSSITTNATTTAKKRRVGDSMEYLVTTTFSSTSASEGQLIYTLPDTIDTTKINNTASGTEVLGTAAFYDNSGGSATGRLIGEVRYASSTTVTVAVMDDASGSAGYMDNVSGSGNYPVVIAASDKVISRFTIPVTSLTASTVLKQDLAGWFVDANISGANPSLGVAAVTSYTEIIDAGLTMTPRTNSAPVGIMCSTTNAATAPSGGATVCAAGSESIGANFVIPVAGTYEVCFYGSNTSTADTGEGIFATFELIETPTSAQTLTLEGGTRIQAGQTAETIATGVDQVVSGNISNCSLFNWGAGTKGVRLMYEQSVTGTPDAHAILGDAGANNGQRDMRITVRPWVSAQNAPLLVGSVIARDNTSDVTTINTVVSKSAGYTATTQDETIITASGPTITLPPAANVKGKKYHITASGATSLQTTIDPNASETVCGVTTIKVGSAYDAVEIQSDGTNWIGLGDSCWRTDRATVTNNSGAQAVTLNEKNWLATSSCSGTGVCTYAITSGLYSVAPSCTCSANLSAATICSTGTTSTTAVTIGTYSGASVATNETATKVVCRGPR